MSELNKTNSSYVETVLEHLKKTNPNEPEFHQAATEILTSLAPVVDKHPEYKKAGLLERFVEPERVILFRVPWVDGRKIKILNEPLLPSPGGSFW